MQSKNVFLLEVSALPGDARIVVRGNPIFMKKTKGTTEEDPRQCEVTGGREECPPGNKTMISRDTLDGDVKANECDDLIAV
jgi:hypothetical protein